MKRILTPTLAPLLSSFIAKVRHSKSTARTGSTAFPKTATRPWVALAKPSPMQRFRWRKSDGKMSRWMDRMMNRKMTLMIGLIAVLTVSGCLSRRSSTTVTAPTSISTTMTAAAGTVEVENASSRTFQVRIDTQTAVLSPSAKTTFTGFSGTAGTAGISCDIYESGKQFHSSTIKVGSSITIR